MKRRSVWVVECYVNGHWTPYDFFSTRELAREKRLNETGRFDKTWRVVRYDASK